LIMIRAKQWKATSATLKQRKPVRRQSQRQIFRLVEELVLVVRVESCVSECTIALAVKYIVKNVGVVIRLGFSPIAKFVDHIGASVKRLKLGD
jgi:hypothetical protein